VVVAEVGDQDIWGRAGLAAAALSSDRNLAMRVLEAAPTRLRNNRALVAVSRDRIDLGRYCRLRSA